MNSLWKLLSVCYNRDYFLFIRELLPFVIKNYDVFIIIIIIITIVLSLLEVEVDRKYQEKNVIIRNNSNNKYNNLILTS